MIDEQQKKQSLFLINSSYKEGFLINQILKYTTDRCYIKNYVHICWKTNPFTVIDSSFPFHLLSTCTILSFLVSCHVCRSLDGSWHFDFLVWEPQVVLHLHQWCGWWGRGAHRGVPGRSGWCARGMCCCPEGSSQAGQLSKEEHKVLSLGRSKPRTLWRIPSRELGKALEHLVSTKLNKSLQKVNCALGCVGSIVTSRSRRGSLPAHPSGAHPWAAVSSLGSPGWERQGHTGESQTLRNISFSALNGEWGWPSTRTGCPGRWWSFPPQRCSKAAWMWSWSSRSLLTSAILRFCKAGVGAAVESSY